MTSSQNLEMHVHFVHYRHTTDNHFDAVPMLVRPQCNPHKSIKHTAGPIFEQSKVEEIRYRKGNGKG
jgi:hypothetical protein